jgi:hypothetical protein
MKQIVRAVVVIAIALAPVTVAHPGHGDDADDAADSESLHSSVSIEARDGIRYVTSNGIPNHATGEFPNRHNPGHVQAQEFEFRMPADPKAADHVTPLGDAGRPGSGRPMGPPAFLFGVALNGGGFDPGTAEWFSNDPRPGWHVEAIGPARDLGIDSSNAHVQPPSGTYHYHGVPKGLVDKLAGAKGNAMLQVGWAADGFPIYAIWGYADAKDPHGKVVSLKSSYKLKTGTRPSDANSPGGKYDGSYTQDYEFVRGSGDLDECNGRYGVTPEFPNGTYYYLLTETFPFVPRFFRGTPDESFRHKPPMRRGQTGEPRETNR